MASLEGCRARAATTQGEMRRFLIGLVITVVCVGLLIRLIDRAATISALKSADPVLIVLAVTFLMMSIAAKTARWRLLLPTQAQVTTRRLYRILHISFLLNNVLPARLGDVARVALASRQPGLRSGHVLSSLLTERVTDTVTLIAGFVVVSPFLPIPDQYRPWLYAAWFALAGLFVVVVALALARRPLSGLLERLSTKRFIGGNERIRAEARSFREGWRQLFSRQHVLRIWGWSWMAWGGAFAINYVLMRSLNINAPVTVAVLLTFTTNLAMLIPSSPGYIGVFHAAATLSLAPFGVGPSHALSFAILAHLVNVVPVSILGASFLLLGRESLNLNLGALRRAPAVNPAADL
ncbi:MAG: hypothetical protein C0506_07590 [Anaerolinea sp.]|nr:hypothetical protein [Anaerolinea sp.]